MFCVSVCFSPARCVRTEASRKQDVCLHFLFNSQSPETAQIKQPLRRTQPPLHDAAPLFKLHPPTRTPLVHPAVIAVLPLDSTSPAPPTQP